jgi:hypothetical protein
VKDFGEWFNNPARRVPAPSPAPAPAANPITEARAALEDALEGVGDVYISYHVPCRVCERRYEWPVAIEEYEPGVNNYCGGSPRCCP